MRQSRFTVEEIIRIIAESELPTSSIAGTARNMALKRRRMDCWLAKYKGMGKSEAKRLKVLEDENRQLKRLVADKELIIQTLNDSWDEGSIPARKRQVIRELRHAPAAGVKPSGHGQSYHLAARPATSAGGCRYRESGFGKPLMPRSLLAIGASPWCSGGKVGG